ncbi:MAG: hypothetical protein Faunusvirus13_22 [Faunusvirus sp.]|jgi:hypothetical protein|uniref:Uncharacterized protein n=1 Tax=Faunusvirus sp. TaxID=2487766 RepID=A0A3G5A1Q5_9VIRU|nr:MAG: hypothetical protein Faunusvirus13_22 [Faunusvirus sp.]
MSAKLCDCICGCKEVAIVERKTSDEKYCSHAYIRGYCQCYGIKVAVNRDYKECKHKEHGCTYRVLPGEEFCSVKCRDSKCEHTKEDGKLSDVKEDDKSICPMSYLHNKKERGPKHTLTSESGTLKNFMIKYCGHPESAKCNCKLHVAGFCSTQCYFGKMCEYKRAYRDSDWRPIKTAA